MNWKQLCVLLVVAAWVSVAANASYINDAFLSLPRFIVYSLPAVLFGAIFFFWFGGKK